MSEVRREIWKWAEIQVAEKPTTITARLLYWGRDGERCLSIYIGGVRTDGKPVVVTIRNEHPEHLTPEQQFDLNRNSVVAALHSLINFIEHGEEGERG